MVLGQRELGVRNSEYKAENMQTESAKTLHDE